MGPLLRHAKVETSRKITLPNTFRGTIHEYAKKWGVSVHQKKNVKELSSKKITGGATTIQKKYEGETKKSNRMAGAARKETRKKSRGAED